MLIDEPFELFQVLVIMFSPWSALQILIFCPFAIGTSPLPQGLCSLTINDSRQNEDLFIHSPHLSYQTLTSYSIKMILHIRHRYRSCYKWELYTALLQFNSQTSLWKKGSGAWKLTVVYVWLNAKMLPLAPVVSDIMVITNAVAAYMGDWYTVIDVANAFSIPLQDESQDQYEFTWNGLWHAFTALLHRNFNSPVIWHQ